MKKLLMVAITLLACSCTSSVPSQSTDIRTSKSVIVEDNSYFTATKLTIDSVEYLVIRNTISGGIAVTKIK